MLAWCHEKRRRMWSFLDGWVGFTFELVHLRPEDSREWCGPIDESPFSSPAVFKASSSEVYRQQRKYFEGSLRKVFPSPCVPVFTIYRLWSVACRCLSACWFQSAARLDVSRNFATAAAAFFPLAVGSDSKSGLASRYVF